MNWTFRLFVVFTAICLLGSCGDDPASNGGEPDAGPGDNIDENDAVNQNDDPGEPADYPVSRCDDINPGVCAFPWPSNLYLEPDDDRASGHQLRFGDESLPESGTYVHISPHLFDHLDGYDPGVPIMTRFSNLDDSELPDEYEIEASMADDASILLYEVVDGQLERIPYWAELDSLEDDPEKQTLFVRPAEILRDDTRYIVAFRDLVDVDGDPIEPSQHFELLIEGETSEHPVLKYRQQRFDEVFDLLETDGVDSTSLTLAWDFHIASSDALHGPMLQIRDDAFEISDQTGLDWSVDSVTRTSNDPEDDNYDPYIGLTVEATVDVPHYLKPYEELEGTWQLNRTDDGAIEQDGMRQVPVLIRIPHRALDDGDEIGVLLFGHGLFGSRTQIYADHLGVLAEELGLAVVALDLIGMSHNEVSAAMELVVDLNHFVAISDRLHQGLLEYLLAARTAPSALSEMSFDSDDIDDVVELSIDPDDTHYMGGSQGGIFGGSFMALSPDVDRGFLAVPGNNYSTLLRRSINFDQFEDGMALSYRSATDRNINIAIMNLLWSTTEPASYLRHIRDEPFDGEPNDVLLGVAKGDYQVATITNENAARSNIGLPLLEPYDEARPSPFGVDQASYPHDGSGTVLFDFGNPWPAPGNQPPDDAIGDPHGWLSSVEPLVDQLHAFWRDGTIIDICDGSPCQFDAPVD